MSLAFPCFAEHVAVVCEPASDWGASVGMHSTGVKLFSVPVCGPQNDGSDHAYGNLAGFHSATWQDSIPVLLPFRDGFKEPRHDGMKLHGTDAGDAFRLG